MKMIPSHSKIIANLTQDQINKLEQEIIDVFNETCGKNLDPKIWEITVIIA